MRSWLDLDEEMRLWLCAGQIIPERRRWRRGVRGRPPAARTSLSFKIWCAYVVLRDGARPLGLVGNVIAASTDMIY